MTPILYAAYFGGDDYVRMARVLEHTARVHCQGWDIRVERATPPVRTGGQNDSHRVNTQKMDCWLAQLAPAVDGDCILFLDADTFIVRPLDAIWVLPFDLAYTIKPGAHPPFNTGVVAVRVSARIRAWFELWHGEQLRMLRDALYHHPFHRRYGGTHQAALGALLERRQQLDGPGRDLDILGLPCLEWNCENSAWAEFNPRLTRIVHIKDPLRKAVFKRQPPTREVWPIVQAWRQAETRATVAVGA